MTLALLWPVSQDLERKEARRVCSEGNDGCKPREAPEVVGREARGSGRDLGALSQGSGLGEPVARVPATAESGERAATAVGGGAGVELAQERSLWAVGGLLIKKLGLEAVDSSRYRRLMARNRMGIGSNFGELCAFAVAIAGVGRVGSTTADVALLPCYSLTTTSRNQPIRTDLSSNLSFQSSSIK